MSKSLVIVDEIALRQARLENLAKAHGVLGARERDKYHVQYHDPGAEEFERQPRERVTA